MPVGTGRHLVIRSTQVFVEAVDTILFYLERHPSLPVRLDRPRSSSTRLWRHSLSVRNCGWEGGILAVFPAKRANWVVWLWSLWFSLFCAGRLAHFA